MRRFLLLACTVLFLWGNRCSRSVDYTVRNRFGGCPAISGTRTGFFHTQKINGRWYLVDPLGNGYLAAGMTHLGEWPEQRSRWNRTDSTHLRRLERFKQKARETYPTREAWVSGTVSRLKQWGFNHLMANPRHIGDSVRFDLPYSVLFHVGDEAFADVFSPLFEEKVQSGVVDRCSSFVNDTLCIGYYSDNELAWNIFWGGGMLDQYLSLPDSAPGAHRAVSFLTDRYSSIDEFNAAWNCMFDDFNAVRTSTNVKPGSSFDRTRVFADRDEFLSVVSRRYYGYINAALKKSDPNHLYLGTRFLTGDLSLAIARGMKGNVDVISCNSYLVHAVPDELFAAFSREADAPILITEFGYRAKEGGIPVGGTGAIPRVVTTQRERADLYEWYASHLISKPYIVGTLWWWYMDGYGGGYAGNFGFVDWDFEPYPLLVEAAKRVHRDLYHLAEKGADSLVEPMPPVYTASAIAPPVIDGSIDSGLVTDIVLTADNAYEGYDFATSGLSARGLLRTIGDSLLYLGVTVTDTQITRFDPADARERSDIRWNLDGVEFYFGPHQGLLYFDGPQGAVTFTRSDPFPGTVVSGALTGKGYCFELIVPIKLVAHTMTGDTLRFAFGVNDGSPRQRHRQIFYPPSYEWMYPTTFARALLPD